MIKQMNRTNIISYTHMNTYTHIYIHIYEHVYINKCKLCSQREILKVHRLRHNTLFSCLFFELGVYLQMLPAGWNLLCVPESAFPCPVCFSSKCVASMSYSKLGSHKQLRLHFRNADKYSFPKC